MNSLSEVLKQIPSNEPCVGDVFQLVKKDGKYRAWKVTGIFLGALNQEDTISLKPCDKMTPQNEIHIPLDIFNSLLNFNRI